MYFFIHDFYISSDDFYRTPSIHKDIEEALVESLMHQRHI